MSVVSALIAGLGVYWLLDGLRGQNPKQALAEFHGAQRHDWLERIGERLLQWLPLRPDQWADDLRWAAYGGAPRVSMARLVGRAALYTLAGYAILVLMSGGLPRGMLTWALPWLLGYYPLLQVRNQARRAIRAVKRQIPEVASIVAAELAAGASADIALQRVADLPGPLTRFLADVIAYARTKGQPLFSQAPLTNGALRAYTQEHARRIPELQLFASQLDLVAQKGAHGALLMADIAKAMAREYRATVMTLAKKLDSQLVLAAVVFYFAPFVAFLLWLLGAPALILFTGG